MGLDAAILMNPQTWEASGHLGNSDPMIDCRQCQTRHRADQLIEGALQAQGIEQVVDGMTFAAVTFCAD